MYACSNRHFDYANSRIEKNSNSTVMLPGKCIVDCL